jgi:hypothetical protein
MFVQFKHPKSKQPTRLAINLIPIYKNMAISNKINVNTESPQQ